VTDVAEALALHAETVVVDLHADTPAFMRAGYDFFARHAPVPRAISFGGHVDLPRMREGGLCAQVFGIWTFPRARGPAKGVHKEIDVVAKCAAARPEDLVIAWTADDIRAAHASGRRAALLSIEGAHALEGSLDNLGQFARLGVRSLGLLHFSKNPAGHPAYGLGKGTEGLTDFGRELVGELDRLGVLVDLAHINRAGFLEAAARTTKPAIVSHTGVSGVHAHWRNVDDEQIRAVASTGGCIGVIFAPRYLGRDGLAAVVDHIEHLIRAGGEDVPALGSDFDGFVRPPSDLPDVAALPRVTAEMLRRGWTRERIAKILGGNFLRVLGAVPPRAREGTL